MEPEYQYLSVRLRLEEQRLHNWGSETGLLKYADGGECDCIHEIVGLSHTTVVETLMQIHRLIAEFIHCREKCGELVPDETLRGDLETRDACSRDTDSDRFPDFLQFLRKPSAARLLAKSLPKRLKWAACYRDKYEQLVNKVRDLNDVLIDLVDSDARIAIRRTTQETNTTILHLHNRIEELVQLVKASSLDGVNNRSMLANHKQRCRVMRIREHTREAGLRQSCMF